MRFIAVDPGGTTGWAEFNDGVLQNLGELKEDALYPWLELQSPDLWVIENYRIRPKKLTKGFQHVWSSVVPAQVIGAFKYQAYLTNAEIVLQEPAIKPLGAKCAGLEYTTDAKRQHQTDALYHAFFYMRGENRKEGRP